MPGTQLTTLRADTLKVLDNILAATPEGVIVVDESMKIAAGNNAAHKAFSRSAFPLCGRQFDEILTDEQVIAAFQNACSRGQTSDLHLKYATNGGKKRYDVHVAPIILDEKQNAVGYFYDVTQVHRLENIRQEFLSNISHELRTPLTSILAFVETLEDGGLEDGEHNRHFLSVIRRNGERMRNLIADILELSQIESGNVSLSRVPVDLHRSVDEIITNLSSMAQSRKISLRNDVPSGSTIAADSKRLEQMLTNLIDNAIRFNRHSGSVTISYEEQDESDLVSVEDTGEGIGPKELQRVFERFYRIDRARTREVGGTGLGLAIVKHLARLHGGEVSVESQVGVGTKFTINLPRL
jgi:two-component system, OmpR family, phosphate regulon sensor histidine kinase PhoR